MRLSAGTLLGPYAIVSELGAGGMGEVYRARDTRLGRDVAVKILPIGADTDPSLRARFEREAKALAALNHPNIAAIHDVVDAGDHRAIVMELVPGRTLQQLLASGPLTLRDVIEYGIDVSDALGVAHNAGIIHRDLKPSNIIVTDNGTAKILDFGIAKRGGLETPGQKTRTATFTEDRALVGTLGYMSPEQAHGTAIDTRSDIFSLGVVLYEAIAGRAAFQGETTAALLSAVLRDDPPPLRSVVPATPRALERCVMRCLDKNAARRYQHAGDLKLALEDVRDDLASPSTPDDAAPDLHEKPIPRFRIAVAALAAAAAGTIGLVVGSGMNATAVVTPRFHPFITDVARATSPAWSPDGRTLAYLGVVDERLHLFVRGVDAPRSTQLTKEPLSGRQLFWAPDGSRLYFGRARDGMLVSVGASGGEPQVVRADGSEGIDIRGAGTGISPDGRTIVFSRGTSARTQLFTLGTSSGQTSELKIPGLPESYTAVQALAFSPDGATLAVIGSTTALNQSRGIWLVSWPGGPARQILADALYVAAGFSIGWMPDSRRVVMSASPLHGGTSRLLMADTVRGTLTPLTGGRDTDLSPAVSGDGRRIAFVAEHADGDLIQFPVDGGPPEPLLATSRTETYPDISRSGLLAYIADAEGTPAVRIRSAADAWSRALADATAPESERIPRPAEVRLSPDDQRVAIGAYGADHLIYVVPTAGGAPLRLDTESTDHHGPSWSPDGNWIAYRRLVGGKWSIVKVPLGGGPVVVLDDADSGGGATDWSPTGQWIAHSRPDGMHLVSPGGGPARVLAGLSANAFRFSRDGSRLFAVRRRGDRQWELSIWDVAAGRESKSMVLPVATATDLRWLALSYDETRVVVSAHTARSDIWLLEDFEPAASLWSRLFR